uniref:Uncharacterized protein n=1 Tax=Trichobilharzia regenti TaxID=157069 RepID=A0AA85IYB9_TRIRE|nr:unnamed protein product [Trichobilharzia regenti]
MKTDNMKTVHFNDKVNESSYENSISVRSYIIKLVIFTSVMMSVTILITQLITDIQVLRDAFSKQDFLAPFILFIVATVLLMLVIFVEKLKSIRPLMYTMISIIVILYSIGVTAVCSLLDVWYNLLALVLTIVFAVTAVFIGYKIQTLGKKASVTMVIIASTCMLCSVVFFFLGIIDRLYLVFAGLFASIGISIICPISFKRVCISTCFTMCEF